MEKRRSRKFYRKNRWVDVLAALILVAVLALSLITLRDYVKSRLLHFAPVQEGSIAVTIPGEILVLRNEYTLTASLAGEFVPQAAEGERVKEGGIVGYCGGVAITAPKGGVVSYLLDGWEEKLLISSIYDFDWDQVFALLKEQHEEAADATALNPNPEPELEPITAAHRPVARLVDNLLDYKVMLKLRDPNELLKEEQRITFSHPEGKTFTNSISESWQTAAGEVYYIFDISSKEDRLFSLRYSPVEVIAREVSGIIIPAEAVHLDEQGRSGVFIQKKRKLVFTEVEELTSKDGFSVVKGLDSMAVVVTNPAKAKDGQRI